MSQAAVKAATDSFYSALNLMFTGDGGPVKDAWSHAEDVTYMGPSGEYSIGWNEIEKEWDKQAAAKLGGKVTPEKLHIVAGETLAFINCVEAGQNVVNGKVEPVKLRSSTIFRKENGAWKIVAHQTDLLGYMSAPK
jgi:ketosteroid isomerase-like protein